MLERTAAGLETGHLHRVLPRSTRPQAARHLRQPRASFSQSHGPASVARRPEPHGSRENGASQGHDNPSPLLDFLYPKRTHPLLRRQSFPSLPLRSRSPWPACSAAQRRYESTDSSNRPSGQPSTAEPEDGAPAEAEEQTGRKFDHTKWQDTGATLRPKRTYSVEEEDDDLLYGNEDHRRTADAVEQAESMLDAAWSRTRDIETRLPERNRARPNPYRSYGHMDYEDSLVDLEMEKELKMSLKAQILEEEEMDRDLEEQEEPIPVSEETEIRPGRSDSAGDSAGEPADQGEEPVAQQAEKASSRFTRPSEPLYKLPKGERPDPPKEDAPGDESEAHVKRRSRFAEPEQPTEPLQEEEAVVDEVAEPAEVEEAEEPQRPLTIYEMLEDVQGAHYHALYDAHVRLDEEERDRMRPQVIAYLAKSRSVVEAGRVKALFRQTSVDDWTGEMLSAVVLVYLRTGERTQAFDAFRTGLRKFGLTGGFEYLLIDSVNKHQWHVALDVWLVYCKNLAERTPGRVPDVAMLKPFSSLDSLGGLYFLFERYLAAAERKVERFLDDKPVTKQALYVFRRAFAKAALESCCPPKQARVILDWWYNQRFYERYIWDMTSRWNQKQISSDTARELIPIYEDLHAMPGIKISSSALSCMFRVCYPHNGQTLEQLHQDWVQMHGDLDSWGYRRFMKFYSHRGDAERVKTLWEKYIKLYPGELTHAQSFNSIMNAYAQSGDTDGAEAELQRMQEQYHIAPDISLMNAKLKCYMRAGNYKETLACFNDILTNFKPDAYTYAHVMAMCAKKGDTDKTIDFFNAAQDRRVPITKEMVLALVVAYCGNDQIGAAEELTRRLAGANITSAAIWNHIVVHHGKKARLDKCYKILDEMKERGIEWDRDTIDNLLQALAQVKQTGPAYQVLKTATQEQQSIVQPEHYITVMVGAARNRDVASADGVYELLMKAGIPVPFNAMVAYTDLMLERKSKAKRTATLPRQMVDSLRVLVNDVGKMDIQKRRQQTRRVPWCIQLLIEFRDFDAIEEVVTLYTQLFPEYKNGNLPPDIIASLMQGYQRDENYDRVIALWDESWPRLLSERVQPSGEGIYPAHEYDMDRLVYRLADAYRSLNSTKPLAAAIEQVHKAGFKLTTHTWDRVIGAFALTGNWKIGVRWCETVLMAGWAGWTRRLTSRERRARQNPRVLWPQRRTILALREGWIADRQLAAWSGPIARALVNLDIDYPRTVNAFRDSLEPEVAGGPWIMTRKTSMEQLLKPLPLHELKVMDRELRRFLDDEDEVTQRTKSPFRVLSERDDRLRSLSRGEMMRLKGLLDRVLPAETVEVSEVVNEDEKVAASTGDSASG